jgi:hypothetical protein
MRDHKNPFAKTFHLFLPPFLTVPFRLRFTTHTISLISLFTYSTYPILWPASLPFSIQSIVSIKSIGTMTLTHKRRDSVCSIASTSSQDSTSSRKSVSFSSVVTVAFTHPPIKYDRSSHQMARLSFRDHIELMQMRAELRRQQEQAWNCE